MASTVHAGDSAQAELMVHHCHMPKPPKDASFDPELYWEQTLERLSVLSVKELTALVREHAEAFREREQGLAEPATPEQNLELSALAQVLSERDPSTRAAVDRWRIGVKDKPSGPLINVLSQCAEALSQAR